jgi:hypothetical protein
MPIVDSIKNIAATIGVIIPLGGIYTAAGLPVPATISQVDSRINPLREGLVNLQLVVLQQQRESISARRNFLRQDKFQIQTANGTTQNELQKRLNESRVNQIEDSLREIEAKDLVIQKKIEELTSRPWLGPPPKEPQGQPPPGKNS